MRKIAKIIKLLLTISISIFVLLNTIYAFDLKETEKIEIQEQFDHLSNALKNGDIETILKYICVKDPTWDLFNGVTKFVPYADIAKDVISRIDGNDYEFIKTYFAEIFKKYNFTLNNTEKIDVDKYSITVALQIPDDDYYSELEELLNEKGEQGQLLDLIEFLPGSAALKYMFKGRVIGRLRSEQNIKAFVRANENNHGTKQIERILYLKKDNERYIWEIDSPKYYNGAQGKYEYNGNDNDDRHLMQYLFIPIWTLIQDFYKR